MYFRGDTPGRRIALKLVLPPVMKYFADVLRKVTVLLEKLRQGDDVWLALAEMRGQVPDAESLRPQSG